MFLSRIPINPQRRQAKFLLANPRAMHAAVESAFPPRPSGDGGEKARDRNLWRVDRAEHAVTLYVVSTRRPDLRHIQEQAGWETAPGESTDYGLFLDTLMTGQRWRFRLAANPVKQRFVQGGRGARVPLTHSGQLEWIAGRAEQNGFALCRLPGGDDSALDVRVVERRDREFAKPREDGNRRSVTQRRVVFDGTLEVTDPELLRAALIGGIGRSKAYGCGLLTLARDGEW